MYFTLIKKNTIPLNDVFKYNCLPHLYFSLSISSGVGEFGGVIVQLTFSDIILNYNNTVVKELQLPISHLASKTKQSKI